LFKPAKVAAMLLFEGRYVRIVPEGHVNLVQTIEKPVLVVMHSANMPVSIAMATVFWNMPRN